MGRPCREVPRPERPRRLRRSRGSWSAMDVVQALRAWSNEVGSPPRSYDWSPSAARAGGFPLAGAQKWEAEYPRWPHRAFVCARFGSWRAALDAAGLPVAAPLRVGRRERVAIAQRLESELSAAEIAALIGV